MAESRRLRWTRYFRERPELMMFLVAVPLFVGGLATVLVNQFRPVAELSSISDLSSDGDAVPAKGARLGPSKNDLLSDYIPKRTELLKTKAEKQPRQASFAVISFDSYRKVGEVEEFVKVSRLDVVAVQMRIPLPTFDPQSVAVGQRTVAAVVAGTNGSVKLKELTQELVELDEIIPTVTDPAYREVYVADADVRRKAIALLRSDPSLVFALVVKGSNANLAKASGLAEVRFVDVADSPSISFDSHDFFGLLPEDTVSSSWP